MKEIKKNTILLVFLVALIVLNYVFAENNMAYSVYIIACASAIKFMAITFQFIEAKHAHPIWKLLSFLFIGIYLIGILVLY